MSVVLKTSGVSIHMTGDEAFVNGFQVGHTHFLKDFASLRITDEMIYTLIMQNIINVQYTDRHNAGYIYGWIYASLQQKQMPCTQLELPLSLPPTQATGRTEVQA